MSHLVLCIVLIVCSVPTVISRSSTASLATFITPAGQQQNFRSLFQPQSSRHSNNSRDYNYKSLSLQKNREEYAETTKVVLKELWYLPVLSLLSGLTPACRIIADSHISRLPDCPIAHEMDTRLLWSAIASSSNDQGLPPSIFQTPVAAITDSSLYDVQWNLVWNAYITRVGIVAAISFILMTGLIAFLTESEGGEILGEKINN